MDTLERYLQAVQFWLPRSQQRDIIAELREDLSSQIEDKESALNRSLNAEEVAAIVKQCGHPMVVASRYQPQRQLIGPVLFPVYVMALKAISLFYLLPWLLVWICLVSFVPSYRAVHGINVASALDSLWNLVIYLFGAATLGFVVAERVLAEKQYFANWNPGRLPKVVQRETHKRVPRRESLAGLLADLVVLVAWTNLYYGVSVIGKDTADLSLNPGLRAYYLPVMLLMLMDLALNVTTFFRPQWTWLPPAVRALSSAGMLAIVGSVYRLQPWLLLKGESAQSVQYVKMIQGLNQGIAWSIGITAAALAIAMCIYAYQAVRRVRSYRNHNGAPAAMISSQMM
jgi:hypothetical protein